jgi:hypothetical protein
MLLIAPHPLDPFQTDPTIVESQTRAAKMTRTFCERGLEAFEFKSENGQHYVVTRNMEAIRCMEFDQLVAYTSPRMIEALGRPWCEGGRA